jgi:hypothetical protein
MSLYLVRDELVVVVSGEVDGHGEPPAVRRGEVDDGRRIGLDLFGGFHVSAPREG